MALYIGASQVKIVIDNNAYLLQLVSEQPITNGIILLSSDNYILKDSNGLYITAKEDK